MMMIGELKQQIMKTNNTINVQMYGIGLRWQRVDICGNRIIILAENKRITALASIDSREGLNTRRVDLMLLTEYKERLKQATEELLAARVLAVLKDYDPVSELAGTIIVLEEPIGQEAPTR